MRYREPESFRAALEARLREASNGQLDLGRRRRAVAFDRVLSRLAAVEGGRWVLKGGAALEFRMPDRARATRDIDLADTQAVTIDDAVDSIIEAIGGDPFGDHFSFRVTRRRQLSDDDHRGPVERLSVDALIGGRIFEQFVIDVVVALGNMPPPDVLELGESVGFAGLPRVEVLVIDLRTHWAEKLSAYCRRYGDRPNSRVKDLVDLVLLIEQGLEPDNELLAAVERTFTSRDQEVPEAIVPSMADEWADPFQGIAEELGLSTPTAVEAHKLIEEFWQRVLDHGGSSNPEGFENSQTRRS